MPYTQARLDHVLRVFKEASLHDRGQVLDTDNRNHQLRRKYHLRAPATDNSFRHVLYPTCQRACTSDSDDEYDPNHDKKKRKAKSETKKSKTGKRKSTDLGDEQRQLKAARRIIDQGDTGNISTYVTIKIRSNPGRQLLKNFAREYGTGVDIKGVTQNATAWHKFPTASGVFADLAESPAEGRRYRAARRKKLEQEVKLQDLETETATLRNGKRRDKTTDRKRKRESEDEGDIDSKDKKILCLNENNPILPGLATQEEGALVLRSVAPTRAFQISDSDDIVTHTQSDQAPSSTVKDLFETTISTSYAHPMDFQHRPEKTRNSLCNFCDDYRMGVIGLGRRTVNVRVYPDKPHEYHELGGGYRADGHSPTKMCVVCSLSRLQIGRCHGGEGTRSPQFQQIPGHDKVNFSRYIQEMFAASGSSKKHWTQVSYRCKRPVWHSCSICPSPAIWRCSQWQKTTITKAPRWVPAEQTLNSSSAISYTKSNSPPSPPPSRRESLSPVRAAPARGCGLLLCTQCKDFMAMHCAGVIDKDKLLHYLRTQNRLGQRADLEFLFPGSLLEKQWKVVKGGQNLVAEQPMCVKPRDSFS